MKDEAAVRTFAQRATQKRPSAKTTMPGRLRSGPTREKTSILGLQRAIGNQAVRRMLLLQRRLDELESGMVPATRDFNKMRERSTSQQIIHPPLTTSLPGDLYEREAERLSQLVMRAPMPPNPQRARTEQRPDELQPQSVQSFDAGLTNAPPFVREGLRSPGRPLDAATRGLMESRFGYDFGRVRIHTDPTATRSAESLGAAAYTFGTHIAFARSRYRPGTEQGDRLVAHELTHTIQQARLARLSPTVIGPAIGIGAQSRVSPDGSVHVETATSSRISLSPAPEKSAFVGMRLGTNNYGEEVRVTREVGPTQGYDDRLQAIAVARLARAEPAAAVQGYDGKWHALEVTANFFGGIQPADTPTRAIYGLPSSANIETQNPDTGARESKKGEDYYPEKLSELKEREQQLDELLTKKLSDDDRAMIKEKADLVRDELSHATRAFASFVLGVPGSELKFNPTSTNREHGKVNINTSLSEASGLHGPEHGQGDSFEPGMISSWEIASTQLSKPGHAPATMFHEVTHLMDFERTKLWVTKYQQETGRMFVSTPAKALKLFEDWVVAQAPARLSKADAEIAKDLAGGYNATTEARANVRSFLVALQAGASEVAIESLRAYVRELKPGGRYSSPANGSTVEVELTIELETAYRQMTKEMRLQFKAAAAAAMAMNPHAWVSRVVNSLVIKDKSSK